MKVLFVHDHRFFVDQNDDIYTPGQFPNEIWQRYLEHFTQLTVIGRKSSIENFDPRKLSLSSSLGVKFVFLPEIQSPIKIVKFFLPVYRSLEYDVGRADAVIGRMSLLGNLAIEIAERKGKPCAIEVVGCAWDAYWNYGSLLGKIFAPFAFYFSKRCVKKSNHTLYVTRQFLQERYPANGVTTGVSNVELPRVSRSTLENRRNKIINGSPKIVFGIIASLDSKYKGIQTALSAFHEVYTRFPMLELQILGGGNQEPWVELSRSLCLEHVVKFVGVLPSGRAVYEWLDRIDVYLQPSLTEGLPRALIEALSRGCPAIGSTAGGIPELLGDDVLHRPGDSEQLAGLIHLSLSKQWRLNQASKNFNTSKHYTKDKLDGRRKIFWKSFADLALERKKDK